MVERTLLKISDGISDIEVETTRLDRRLKVIQALVIALLCLELVEAIF